MVNKDKIIGKKFDNVPNKPAWDCVPLEDIEGIAIVMRYGAEKYGEGPGTVNWKYVDNGKYRYYAAMMRHLCAYQKGEFLDSESGLPHIDHAMFNMMAYSYFVKKEDKDNE